MSEDERKNYNLVIPDPYPKGKPVVQYPNLEKNAESFLKKHLNLANWNKVKYNKTKYGGGIMNLIKLSENEKNAKIGVVLTDSDVKIN